MCRLPCLCAVIFFGVIVVKQSVHVHFDVLGGFGGSAFASAVACSTEDKDKTKQKAS